MQKVLTVNGYFKRDDGQPIDHNLADRLLRKILALAKRLGCTFYAEWKVENPPDVEDRLG